MQKLPEEYFHLVREALRDDRKVSARKRRKRDSSPREDEHSTPQVVINLDSDDNGQVSDSSHSEDTYDSEEFEDVPEPTPTGPTSDISFTLDASKNEPKQRAKNVVSPEEKKFRRYYHMLHLLCLLVHGYIRNEWLNDQKLHKKLSKLVPDDVFDLLHPPKDTEMPLRSTRKLLDGLKKCMDIWGKHFKHVTSEGINGLYMMKWDDLNGPWEQPVREMTPKLFSRMVISGHGNRNIGAQGFVAMLRACGVNARLVFNAQPPDFTDAKLFSKLKHENEIEQPLSETKLGGRRKKRGKAKKTDNEDEKYPIFWCEVWDKVSKRWITVDPMCQKIIEQIRNRSKLEPQGKFRQHDILRYIIGYDRKKGCRDVTRRYVLQYNSKARRRRVTKDQEGLHWYEKVLHKLHKRKRTRIDDFEDEYFVTRDETEGIPDNLQDLKNHPFYVLENDLKWNEVLRPGCKECGYLRLKNAKSTMKVYKRKDIWILKSAQRWYNEGRILKTGAVHAKVINSKDFKTGEKIEERLYPLEETELFVPEPLGPHNEVPKNHYGNIDIYTPSMIPQGACLIESPVAVKAAAFVEVEFAKAVTGFKFEKHRVAKPQITGVVVSLDYREAVEAMIDGIEGSMEEEKRRDHELEGLQYWNLLLAKLRIKQKLNARHGVVRENQEMSWDEEIHSGDEDLQNEGFSPNPGGFLPEAGGFLPGSGNVTPVDNESSEDAGGFIVENSNDNQLNQNYLEKQSSSEGRMRQEHGITSEEEKGAGSTFQGIEEPEDDNKNLELDYEKFMNDFDESESPANSNQSVSDSEYMYESE